ncbi:MAG: hypothetical protein H7A51_18095 [Akkermansiaceae bacterium]|nr:hypothetical protein [Akkermansiaceae bacterium]
MNPSNLHQTVKSTLSWLMAAAICTPVSLTAQAKPTGPATAKQNEPLPVTISLAALGHAKPVAYTSPENYLKKFRGIDLEMDKHCELIIREGKQYPITIPPNPDDSPPKALNIMVDRKKYVDFSLSIGAVTQRIPVARGKPVTIYQQKLIQNTSGDHEAAPGLSVKRKVLHKLPLSERAQHMLMLFIQPKHEYSWSNHTVKQIDVSPDKLPDGSIVFLNLSSEPLFFSPTSSVNIKDGILMPVGALTQYQLPEDKRSARYFYFSKSNPKKIISAVRCNKRKGYISLVYAQDLIQPDQQGQVTVRVLQIKAEPLNWDEVIKVRERARTE